MKPCIIKTFLSFSQFHLQWQNKNLLWSCRCWWWTMQHGKTTFNQTTNRSRKWCKLWCD